MSNYDDAIDRDRDPVQQITPEQISAYRQQRVKQCGAELAPLLRAVLDKYNCDMVATPQIVDGKIVAVIQLASKD